jgi:unsaturated chondroitin disaccharide hydrolase
MIALACLVSACRPAPRDGSWEDASLSQAAQQLKYALRMLPDSSSYPRTTNPDGRLNLVDAGDWTSGYFPGSLWYLFGYTQDKDWEQAARRWTAAIEPQKQVKDYHDIGLMLYCSFGNGYRFTKDPAYRQVLLAGARSLASRYHPAVKAIRSWDWGQERWSFPVIIDNMMVTELLFWAARESGDSSFYDIAFNHGLTTLNNHFRPDNSSYHVVDYDPATGKARKRETFQGYADESAWARGQAWGLYGFTYYYRETKDPRFLNQAEKIAAFYLDHPNLPADKIPYWDFNAPRIPQEPRDASAAAIAASALLELSQYSPANRDKYWQAAETMLQSLSSPAYLAAVGKNNGFILMHSTGFKPAGQEIDKPLNYADYYYLEAMLRYKASKQKRQ